MHRNTSEAVAAAAACCERKSNFQVAGIDELNHSSHTHELEYSIIHKLNTNKSYKNQADFLCNIRTNGNPFGRKLFVLFVRVLTLRPEGKELHMIRHYLASAN